MSNASSRRIDLADYDKILDSISEMFSQKHESIKSARLESCWRCREFIMELNSDVSCSVWLTFNDNTGSAEVHSRIGWSGLGGRSKACFTKEEVISAIESFL